MVTPCLNECPDRFSRPASREPAQDSHHAVNPENVCAFCGDSPNRTLASWSMTLRNPVTSLNERRTNNGASRFAYKRERDTWGWEIRVHAVGIPKATGPRRLQITRMVVPPSQLMDAINFAGGCKPLTDALRLAGLIVDDTPTMLVDHYRQERRTTPTDRHAVVVQLDDLRPEVTP